MLGDRENIINAPILKKSLKVAIRKLNPASQFRNPVMFVTYLCALATTCIVLNEIWNLSPSGFTFQIALWMWSIVFISCLAEAIAENLGVEQAQSLKKTKVDTNARLLKDGVEIQTPVAHLQKGDIIVCMDGDIIPTDGDVVAGVATVDESAITGESAPVIRESGGDRSAVTAGTRILSDKICIKVTSECGHTFLDRMICLIEGSIRLKSPNEVMLTVVLSALTLLIVLIVISLKFFWDFSAMAAKQDLSHNLTLPIFLALLVCLIPTAIGGLVNTVGIAGMYRLIRYNVIAKSGRSVESAGDLDMIILDKTGTITIGDRMAAAFYPAEGIEDKEFARIAQLASLADETPEGRSIVVFAKTNYSLRAETLETTNSKFIPFSHKTRMSGIDFMDAEGNITSSIRKGAGDAIQKYIERQGGTVSDQFIPIVTFIAKHGGTPLYVSVDNTIVGIIHLKDIIKGGMKERFSDMRRMGIKTLMVTGDNPLTAAAIAAEAGVDDYIAEATPEIKLTRIKQEQQAGRSVAMTGDGTSDAPALAQANVGVAMNTGTQASREAGNMLDLDSNPTKLINIVEIGKQMLMTRGALTTFSLANEAAKCFAIIPMLLGSLYLMEGRSESPVSMLNIMFLHSPQSAILSTVIFSALAMAALTPLALRGVAYTAQSADKILLRNTCIYGLGGLLIPFAGIKLIDMIITFIGLTE